MSDNTPRIGRVAFVANHVPRQCGIATFTSDLCEAVAVEFPATECMVGAVNDRPEGYAYPDRVRFEIAEKEIESYRRAADFLNINNVEIVCVQHEFGIFGGPAGSHLLAFLHDLKMPVVTTLHTILRDPPDQYRRVMNHLMERSDRVVTMSEKGFEFLREIYRVPESKIELIPHGIPDISFIDPNFHKDQFGVEGKTVLLTFGLLGRNKGIEYVIQALPEILAENPDVVYIVLGATHPNVVASEGESYRLGLQRLAEQLGVKRNVIFYDRFVTIDELKDFIGATDIYITPYLNEAQVTSGTLSYSFGAGKAVVSTPYWHAKELLAGERGVLVPFRDAKAIAEGVNGLLRDETGRHAMRKAAYMLGREMVWPQVARRYMECFEKARAGRHIRPRAAFAQQTLEQRPYRLPPFKLDHLARMTDSTGILQHAIYTVPNYAEGYCTDDNARAFMLTVLLEDVEASEERGLPMLAKTYLAFLAYALNRETGRFRNFMSHQRQWLEEEGSEDSHARALWALGTAIGRSRDEGFRRLSASLFNIGLPRVLEATSPRAWAFAILAIHEYLRSFEGDRAAGQVREELSNRLYALWKAESSDGWRWFEPVLTYDNAKLSHACLLSGYWMGRPDIFNAGLDSLRWLAHLQTGSTGCFSPIGSNGWHTPGGDRAWFDQQPLEAYAMVSACLEAARLTRDPFWTSEAERAFEWYLGRNDLGLPVYDSATGGCHDALHSDRLNMNQGAESALAFYLSLAEMTHAQAERSIDAGDEDGKSVITQTAA